MTANSVAAQEKLELPLHQCSPQAKHQACIQGACTVAYRKTLLGAKIYLSPIRLTCSRRMADTFRARLAQDRGTHVHRVKMVGGNTSGHV